MELLRTMKILESRRDYLALDSFHKEKERIDFLELFSFGSHFMTNDGYTSMIKELKDIYNDLPAFLSLLTILNERGSFYEDKDDVLLNIKKIETYLHSLELNNKLTKKTIIKKKVSKL